LILPVICFKTEKLILSRVIYFKTGLVAVIYLKTGKRANSYCLE
jgi:hypothetical protein